MGKAIDKAKLELVAVLEKYAPGVIRLEPDSPEYKELFTLT